jgi:glycosyltransferase involved in cell wall biosynthesis
MQALAQAYVAKGHEVTVLTPSSNNKLFDSPSEHHQVRILRFFRPNIKLSSNFKRFFVELILPIVIYSKFKKMPEYQRSYDGIIWYSPSIFYGYLVGKLKKDFSCKSYLILRDIFPEWALNLQILKPGIIYKALEFFERWQYASADMIGIQAPGNSIFLEKHSLDLQFQSEVLWNWSHDSTNSSNMSELPLEITSLFDKKVIVYSGNMGIAQNIEPFIDLAQLLSEDDSIVFLFLGSGVDFLKLNAEACIRNLQNVVFHHEIPASLMQLLYSNCALGLVSLDLRHKTHNIPGKFISYISAGLPVFANINPNNDLKNIIESNNVGVVTSSIAATDLLSEFQVLMHSIENKPNDFFLKNCRALYLKLFQIKTAADQIENFFINN